MGIDRNFVKKNIELKRLGLEREKGEKMFRNLENDSGYWRVYCLKDKPASKMNVN